METRKQLVGRATGKCRGKVRISVLAVLLAAASLLAFSLSQKTRNEPKKTTAVATTFDNALGLVLTPQAGESRADNEISQLQQRVREGRNVELWLDRLGWAFVEKARESFDPGFYKLAEQCARAIETRNPQSQEAMLLRAHVLQNLHRFKESETLARSLVQQRGLSFDYGLLGDALMEQGNLREAVEAYQRMMNLKPDLRAYARAAHMRWLKGDLEGAIEAMQLAVSAASPSDAESSAWVNTRLAFYEFQTGRVNEAATTVLARTLTTEQLSANVIIAGQNPAWSKPIRRSCGRFGKRREAKSASGISVDASRGAACSWQGERSVARSKHNFANAAPAATRGRWRSSRDATRVF